MATGMVLALKAALSWASGVPASFAPAALAERLAAERERWVLWVPVLIGLGIGVYFVAPQEPSRPLGIGFCAGAVAAAFILRNRPVALLLLLVPLAVAAGLALAGWRTDRVAGPVLSERIGPATVSGRVIDVDRTERGFRILIDYPLIQRLPREQTPLRLRVTLRPNEPAPTVGGWVRLRAIVSPPGGPFEPGAFDFARYAYFRGLGGLGYAVGPVTTMNPPFDPGFDFWLTLRLWQGSLTEKIEAALPGAAGAIAAALLTGERSGIPDEINLAMQLSGLAHLLSISGLHLALVAGIVFFTVRLGLAAIEPLALRWPIKKVAAAAALLASFAYMLVSGAAVPTQRSFLMTALVLIAVMLDRTALSMRVVALSALVVLGFQPDALLEASFQMSFAAVVALIAVYEGWGSRVIADRRNGGMLRRLWVWCAGIALTSMVAGTASGLYALYHFNRFVHYGVIANLIVDPLTAFWIMPLGLLALALMPLGLEAWALTPMGWGLEGLIWVAQQVASWPNASSGHAAMPAWTLAAMTLGGLWLCLWSTNWRWWGLIPIALALYPIAMPDRPDIRVDGQGRVVALRAADGNLLVSNRRAGKAAVDTWARRDGAVETAVYPQNGPSPDGRLRCDADGCTWRRDGLVVALPRREAALADDCRRADLVIATFEIAGRCSGARWIVDKSDLAREGTHAIRLRSDGRVDVRTVAAERGRRPWTAVGGEREER